MNQYQTISNLKEDAKGKLTGRFGNAIIVCVLPVLTTAAINFSEAMFSGTLGVVSTLFSDRSALAGAYSMGAGIALHLVSYLFSQLLSAVIGIFSAGISLYFLNLACGRSASISDLFYGFQYCFGKSLTISLAITLVETVAFLPYYIFNLLFSLSRDPGYLPGVIVCLGIGLLLSLPITLGLSQSYFLLLDFPQYSGKELLLCSMRLMKGHRWELFRTRLSFLPLSLLGALSFGVGDLWVTPYINMTLALYFLNLMRSREANPL